MDSKCEQLPIRKIYTYWFMVLRCSVNLRNGTNLFTVRSDNWNEKLGIVPADQIAVVAGAGGRGPVQPVTLRHILQGLGHFGGYAGLEAGTNLFDANLDAKCSIRFQTTFIPVQGDDGDALGKLEFATEAYNYNTMDDSDPRNLVLLCTSQGIAVQQDGSGAKKLFHHAVDDQGQIHRYWLEAEESKHKVGGEQRETEEERAEAQARGKATSSVIGIRAMGQRFNVLMTIQVPLQQTRSIRSPLAWSPWCSAPMSSFSPEATTPLKKTSGKSSTIFHLFSGKPPSAKKAATMYSAYAAEKSRQSCRRKLSIGTTVTGESTAARVSRGSEYDRWPGLSVKSPKRNASEHITVTVVLYNAAPWNFRVSFEDASWLLRATENTRICRIRNKSQAEALPFVVSPRSPISHFALLKNPLFPHI